MAKSDPNLLTQAEYARSRKDRGLPGGSREAVRRAVDEGRISAFGPDKLVDRDLADSQWERNTRARQSPQAAGVDPTATGDRSGLTDGENGQPSGQSKDTGYNSARARREIADAEKAEIETAKLRGSMVLREDVDRGGFEIGRELRDTMESAVNSLAAEVAALNSAEACAQAIRRHNRTVQEVLARSFREKIGAPAKGAM